MEKQTIQIKCICDCGCQKEADRKQEQCEDCDNGTHYDDINKVYVDYNVEEQQHNFVSSGFKEITEVKQE